MKRRKAVALVMVALVAVSLLIVPAASAKAKRTESTGDIFLIGFVAGEETYPGGNYHVRGQVQVYNQVMDDPRCSGTSTVVVNGNWDSEGLGPVWGTFHTVATDPDIDGGWEGTFTGRRTGPTTVWTRMVGRGCGDLEGMQVFGEAEYDNAPFHATVTDYILDPHGE